MIRYMLYNLMLFPFFLTGMENIQKTPPTLTNLCLTYLQEKSQNLDIAILSTDCRCLLLDSIKAKLYVKAPQETNALLHRAAAYAPHYIPLILHLNSVSTEKFINDDAVEQLHRALRPPSRRHLRTPLLEVLAKLPQDSPIRAEQTIRGLQALLQAGASIRNPKVYHASPLAYSILYHPEEVTLFLLEQSDVDLENYNLFMQAIGKNKLAVVRKLIEKGVKPNKPHNTGSPLNQAVRNNLFEMAQLLLDHGANPNKGALPLAIQNNNVAMTRLLLKYNADPRKKHKIDSIDLVFSSPNKEIQDLLQAHIALKRSPKRRRRYKTSTTAT